jgi:hypothetical protein
VFGVILLVQIVVQIQNGSIPLAIGNLFFIEDRFGNYVFLGGPVAQVPIPAALAAKREVRVDRRVRLRFADWAFMLQGRFFFSLRSLLCKSFSTERTKTAEVKES